MTRARRPEQSAAIVLIVTSVAAVVRFPHETPPDWAFCAIALALGIGGSWAVLRFARSRPEA